MHISETAAGDLAVAWSGIEDHEVARRSSARLLITASTTRRVERLARHIHAGGPRAPLPFVHAAGGDFPSGPQALRERCLGMLDAAGGGSVLISAVEDIQPAVQDALLELLVALEGARRPAAAVRLISGTTVSLLERVAAGAFSERLFYRLNVIHLVAGDGPSDVARAGGPWRFPCPNVLTPKLPQ